jgi:cyclopropane-fatty-acyl-phospholipid synthase
MVTALTNSRFANTLSNSLSNIKAHYDLSNGMFSAFLSRDMTYSCAIYPELDRDLLEEEGREAINGALGLKRIVNGSLKKDVSKEKESDDLEEAQIRKLRHIIKKADIRPGHRVLEIGSGWGSLSMEAVKMTNCTVDTLTLSEQQKALAEERIKAAGLAGRIRVWLMDYRAYVMNRSSKDQADHLGCPKAGKASLTVSSLSR